jgi:arylsulfatase
MSQPATRPNILLITTDQQRFDTIHALGNPSIFTPHLNWLAAQGIAYTRAYVDCPVCAPSRATLMTGRHAHTNGMRANSSNEACLSQNPTLPGILSAAGYQTRAIGKMHFDPIRAHHGFQHIELPLDYHRAMARRGTDIGVPKDHGIGENEMEPVFSTVPEHLSSTRWFVQRTIDFIETRDPTRPFFSWLSFPKPHAPFDCDPRYWALYDNIDLPEPVHGDWSRRIDDMPPDLTTPSRILANAHRFSARQLRNIRRAYYACITQIDYNLGCLFARMRELGHLEDTWILFTSDHGEMLGDHHLGAKGVFLEPSAHVPMLIRPPAKSWTPHPLQNQRCDSLACAADILPTCLAIAGVPVPDTAKLDGLDLLAVQRGDTHRDRILGRCDNRHAVIETRFKYLFFARGGHELLFDLASDPLEQHNLAADPTHAPTLARLRIHMIEHLKRHEPAAVVDGKLVSIADPPTPAQLAGQQWPGFHSPDVPSDVLH